MKSFNLICQQLDDIEAIDYYLAQHLSQRVEPEHSHKVFYLIVALSYFQRHGHTCLSLQAIADKTLFANNDDASPKDGIHFDGLTELIKLARYLTEHEQTSAYFMYQHGRLYTRRYWDFETTVAKQVMCRLQSRPLSDDGLQRLKPIWAKLYSCEQSAQQDWQQLATACAITQQFAVINGGPGTGKTYTVTRLLLALQAAADSPLNIRLAAPTGKAAQRLTESVKKSLLDINGDDVDKLKASITTEASTLHRLLGVRPLQITPKHHKDNPIHCDVLIIDEASMVDLALMARVLSALQPTTRVYLVGDADQLPAVESGNVLEALVGEDNVSTASVGKVQAHHLQALCPHLPALAVDDTALSSVFTLQVSQRFSGKLALAAKGIKEGNAEALEAQISQMGSKGKEIAIQPDVTQMPFVDDISLARLIDKSFKPLFDASTPNAALDALSYCRWLSPVRQGEGGVEWLNREVEKRFLSSIYLGNGQHYHGRPVMVTQNDYVQRLFNGDTGVIWRGNDGQLRAYFTDNGNVRSISLARLPKVETVYAMTIHKSQGSEFEHVVIWLPKSTGKAATLFTRELLYTGLTRAKKGCLLVGSTARLREVVTIQTRRFSGLYHRILTDWQANHSAEK
ncbi:exodeoxyribonuclease V subunit alpha [Alteromonas sp. C1M14]|uniref:exodeoxyribonuclease V subunit alpha n=1 Tax=Alteromonas sp. C1M14 TaxID=2841567 RepID=UPI001C09F378|nr:exodeoxyribonuclease V subunit alpha [Alteromonas sp. C1M14]MBU2977147.1 exodeoxyribonuclease V subunit alpha [Alteromonas sp. C1M14]